jgi:CHAT domain-containing protein
VRNLLLATISSCQSGHQSTTVLGDEFLGINAALLNRGCRFTLSTLWPIFDVVSYVVTSRFYSELARESGVHIESIYRCLTDMQLWVRTSTAAEISDFFQTSDLKVPTMLETLPADSVPFAHPRVWAAYYLSSRCL